LSDKQTTNRFSEQMMSEQIVVAFIGGGFAVIVGLLELTRRQNNRDHGENSKKLDYLAELFRDHLKGHK
jgi:hypothetical protein